METAVLKRQLASVKKKNKESRARTREALKARRDVAKHFEAKCLAARIAADSASGQARATHSRANIDLQNAIKELSAFQHGKPPKSKWCRDCARWVVDIDNCSRCAKRNAKKMVDSSGDDDEKSANEDAESDMQDEDVADE